MTTLARPKPLQAYTISQNPIAAAVRALVAVAATILILARFLPGQTIDFLEPLDNGWARAVSVAAAHGLVFGRDIVFNYGPYGVLATGVYEPGLRGVMIVGGLVLGAAFAAGLAALQRPALSMLLALLLPLAASLDSLAFALPLPALLLCARAASGPAGARAVRWAVLLLLPALSLLPLVKGSYLGITLPALATLAMLLWQSGARRLAVATPAAAVVCLVLLWCAAGQPPGALPAFFAGTLRIIAGYTGSMAADGSARYALLIGLNGVLFLALLIWDGRALRRTTQLALCGGTAILMFVAFKEGFVRQDRVHEIITISAAGLMFVILAHWLTRWNHAAAAAIIGVTLILTGARSDDWRQTWLPAAAQELHADATLLADHAALTAGYHRAIARLTGLPWSVSGPTDIYSYGQLRLFASGVDWSPRPTFQSYAAYTPALAAANAAHLRGPQAPANVIFRVETIDKRLPALDDGPSWPDLLQAYDPVSYDIGSDLVWLRRAPQPVPRLPRTILPPADAIMGRPFPLPTASQALWAQIDTAPTLAGRAAATLWHAPLLQIRLDFANGKSRVFGLPPGPARAGFLLSPFVASTLDFLRLRTPRTGAPGMPPVPTAITVMAIPGGAWAWQPGYKLMLQSAPFMPQHAPVQFQGAAVPHPASLPLPETAASMPPACTLDDIDGEPPPAGPVVARSPLQLNGWALFDRSPAAMSGAIDIALQSQSGAIFAAPAAIMGRQDVAEALHLPNAVNAGFTITLDLSGLPPGTYALLALPHRGSAVRACRLAPSLSVPNPP